MKRGATPAGVLSKKSKNDVVFNDAAFDLDWLQLDHSDAVSNDIKLPEEQSGMNRSGLGFKSDPLQNEKGVLSTRLTKMKQQKLKSRVFNIQIDHEEEEDIGHGIVEQVIDKGSLKIKQKSVFSVDNSKTNNKPPQIEKRIVISNMGKGNKSDAVTASLNNADTSNSKKKDTFKERYNDNKRKKTRSKQKNIRKDNRPAEQRPNYRPITKETKVLMGMDNV